MKYVYVCIFAFIGGALRYELSLLFDPAGTFVVNMVGAFVLGWLSVKLMAMKHTALKTGITAGLVGSFTTFSTFSLESAALIQVNVLYGTGYIAATVLLGMTFAYLGMKWGLSND